MGYYVNPPSKVRKEEWLDNNCTKKSSVSIRWNEIDPDAELVVVLVDNGAFSAAGIAYSEQELLTFSNPMDLRSKVYYVVPIELLPTVSDFRVTEKEGA